MVGRRRVTHPTFSHRACVHSFHVEFHHWLDGLDPRGVETKQIPDLENGHGSPFQVKPGPRAMCSPLSPFLISRVKTPPTKSCKNIPWPLNQDQSACKDLSWSSRPPGLICLPNSPRWVAAFNVSDIDFYAYVALVAALFSCGAADETSRMLMVRMMAQVPSATLTNTQPSRVEVLQQSGRPLR